MLFFPSYLFDEGPNDAPLGYRACSFRGFCESSIVQGIGPRTQIYCTRYCCQLLLYMPFTYVCRCPAAYACFFAHMHACHFIYSCYQQGTCTILLSMWLVYPHQYISILKGMLCLPIAPSKSIYKSCIRFRIICIFHFLWIFLPSFFRSKQLMLGYAIVSGLLCSPYGFKSLSVGYGLPWLFRSKRLIILSIFWRELQLRVCWCTYLTCCAPKITSWSSTLLVVNYLKLTFI